MMSRTKAKGSRRAEKEQPEFVSGDEILDSALGVPGTQDAVDAGLRANAEMDRACAENLAAIRKAGQMTQAPWMAVIAGLIAIEELVPWRRTSTYGTALALLALGVLVLVAPEALPGLTLPGHNEMPSMTPMGS